MEKARPFIKWAGGKGQLLEQLGAMLPDGFSRWENVTYVEPFVGGGAMLFHLLQTYPNIQRTVINDINPKLSACYEIIRDEPLRLIIRLTEIEKEYYALGTHDRQKEYYLQKRREFNGALPKLEMSALLIFINRTCFNGLYRENRKGEYNVPFGRYTAPVICNKELLLADSRVLQRVEVLSGDFEQTLSHARGNTLFYLDPPYRPLSATSNFNDYARQPFNDEAQVRLKAFCDRLTRAGHAFMLSNSDCPDGFFDQPYRDYHIDRVWARRCVNANGGGRGKLTEILVNNYNVNLLRNAI